MDSGIIYSDPWVDLFGRVGIRWFYTDPTSSQASVTTTVEFYTYAIPGRVAKYISLELSFVGFDGSYDDGTSYDKSNYTQPGSGTVATSVKVLTKTFVRPTYYDGLGGQSGVYLYWYLSSSAANNNETILQNSYADYPVRPPYAPKTPGLPLATRASDSQITVGWVNTTPTTPAYIYRSINLIRQQDNAADGSATSLGVVSGYTDNTVSKMHRYRYKVQAVNETGVSSYSGYSNWIYTTPETPSAPTIIYSGALSATAKFNEPSNNGLGVTGYELSYANNSAFSNATIITNTKDPTTGFPEITIGGFSPLTTYYFRVRAIVGNLYSDYSTSVNILTYIGPKVKDSGVWKNSICYLKTSSGWKYAIPYVKDNGAWKIAS